MITIEVTASICGRSINWLFEGRTEKSALKKAIQDLQRKGLRYHDYILV